MRVTRAGYSEPYAACPNQLQEDAACGRETTSKLSGGFATEARIYVHRVVARALWGDTNSKVRQTCGNRLCCAPAHLVVESADHIHRNLLKWGKDT